MLMSSKHQVAASNLRFGDGVTAEVGMDLKNMKARKVINPTLCTMDRLIPSGSRLAYSRTLTCPNLLQ